MFAFVGRLGYPRGVVENTIGTLAPFAALGCLCVIFDFAASVACNPNAGAAFQ